MKYTKYYGSIIFFIFILILSPFVWINLNSSQKKVISHQKVINLGYPINTAGDDFSPSLTADEKIMVFNSKLPGKKNHNIYISRYINGKWSKPAYFKILNSNDNDETPYITPDGSTIIFSSDRVGNVRHTGIPDEKKIITYNLYISKKINGKWAKPVQIPGNVNTANNERSPSLSMDKKTLYFTRWPFRIFRKAKIMQAILKNGKYTDVKELPFPVNSGFYEVAFVPSQNRPGFYLSSRRPGGYGGWDIYFVEYKSGNFKDIINLGPEINSKDNELFLSETVSKMYFCSNRKESSARYDIYYTTIKDKFTRKTIPKTRIPVKLAQDKFTKKTIPKIRVPVKLTQEEPPENKISVNRPQVKTQLRFRVVKKGTDKPLSVKFLVYLKNTPDPQAQELRVVTRKSNNRGYFNVYPKRDVKWIVLKIGEKGFMPFRRSVKVKTDTKIDVQLKIIPVKKKIKTRSKKRKKVNKKKISSTFFFQNIHFNSNSSIIKPEYYPYLQRAVDYLRWKKGSRLKITGHSDLNGANEANDRISINRAEEVRNYFVKMGLHNKRFLIKGMGNKEPIIQKKGKGYDEINRRVEFRILKK